MRKTLLSALLALAATAPAFSSAFARSAIVFSTPSPNVTFLSLQIEGGIGSSVSCSVDLNTTLHPWVVKTAGTLMGQTSVQFAGICSGGSAGLLVGRSRVPGPQGPYHLTYQSFSGTLPNINGVTFRINDVTFWIEQPGVATCLTNGAVDIDVRSTGNPMSIWTISRSGIPLTGGIMCIFASATVSGTASPSFGPTMGLL